MGHVVVALQRSYRVCYPWNCTGNDTGAGRLDTIFFEYPPNRPRPNGRTYMGGLMNKLVAATLFAAVSGLFCAPQTARAGGDETAAAIGGFIGGLIVGSSIDHDHHARYDDHARVHVGASIVIADRDHHHHRGHWETNRIRYWVPGRWVVSFDRRGHRVRGFERGHYAIREERVWVRSGRDRYDVCR